jgi:hypothetical protein
MSAHELILLSPYAYPGQNALVLGNDDMASWLNAYSALWHPAALWQAAGTPRYDAPYDYEQPRAGHVYAIPESPPLMLPEDWDERVRAAGAVAFRASTDRAATLANMRAALKSRPSVPEGFDELIDLPDDKTAPFFGLGVGHQLLSALSGAMEHENLLDNSAFWADVQQAIAELAGVPYTPAQPSSDETAIPEPDGTYAGDFEQYPVAPEGEQARSADEQQPLPDLNESAGDSPEATGPEYLTPPGTDYVSADAPVEESAAHETAPEPWYAHLQSAAAKLLSAREVLYPVTIHLVDLHLVDANRLAELRPSSLDLNLPCNLVASGSVLEKLAEVRPELLTHLRERVQNEQAEVCGGCYLEREDPFLPIDSQLWNLLKGQAVSRALLQSDIKVFARKRFGFHPQMPLFLSGTGLSKALFLTFDDSGVPSYQTCVVSWPSADGKQVEAFVRAPYAADTAQTFFNLGHYLFKTTREDHTATLGFLHKSENVSPWHRDLLELTQLAPVAGQWTTLSRYLGEVMAGEYTAALAADEFHSDFLSERSNARSPCPVSGFARHARLRRRLDTCWTLAALNRGVAGANDPLDVTPQLHELEDQLESTAPNHERGADCQSALDELETSIAATLTERLQARAPDHQPGYMILNPCSFIRRVALELEGAARALPLGGPVKACQLDGDKLKVVVEVPALGFAWIPREGPPGTPPPPSRMRLADKNIVRNEFFEAEVDPATGGLRAIRDHRTRLNRLGQRLVFNPGSAMKAGSIQVTSTGPALGEIVAEGALLGEHQQVLAKFRQRFRAWLGRPVLELRIEIYPEQPPAGYPWHAYFGARFAWRDERAMLLRGVNGTGYITTHTRPQTPDYLELRLARQSTAIFPGGLPFHQRHEGRMLDVILQPEGETAHVFDLGIGLDREQPMQTALGMVTPVPLVPTTKGPPHIGAAGWLFHLDASNLLMSRLYPGGLETSADGPVKDAVTARLLECASHSGHAELRCARNPRRAAILDARGSFLVEANVSGDAVFLEVSPGDLVQVQVEF